MFLLIRQTPAGIVYQINNELALKYLEAVNECEKLDDVFTYINRPKSTVASEYLSM